MSYSNLIPWVHFEQGEYVSSLEGGISIYWNARYEINIL